MRNFTLPPSVSNFGISKQYTRSYEGKMCITLGNKENHTCEAKNYKQLYIKSSWSERIMWSVTQK